MTVVVRRRILAYASGSEEEDTCMKVSSPPPSLVTPCYLLTILATQDGEDLVVPLRTEDGQDPGEL
jgi:hypothetical protein